jgi:hypothetical protein
VTKLRSLHHRKANWWVETGFDRITELTEFRYGNHPRIQFPIPLRSSLPECEFISICENSENSENSVNSASLSLEKLFSFAYHSEHAFPKFDRRENSMHTPDLPTR